jgi:RNA polymerase sigma-70 factor (ECF subfamily)
MNDPEGCHYFRSVVELSDASADETRMTSTEATITDGYQQHSRRMRSYLSGPVNVPSSMVDDVIAETWARAWSARHGFKGDSSLITWLCTIARNVWFETCRRREFRETIAMGHRFDQPGRNPSAAYEAALMVAGVPVIVRQAYYENMTMEELSQEYGISVPGVKSRLRRARMEVAQKIGCRTVN